MVKSLANELTDILDWIEGAGLCDCERARSALVAFCRGLVCGLRTADSQSKEECPTIDKNSQLRPVDECNRVMPGSIPSKD